MMKIKSYGSGSKGNLYYLTTNKTHIILECGLKKVYITDLLNDNRLQYTDLNACITSHCHEDHSMSVKVFDDYNIPCYTTYETKQRYNISDDNWKQLVDDTMYKIGDIRFIPLKVNHGDCECFGFIFNNENQNILFITDFMECEKALNKYKFKEIFIECNYLLDKYNESKILLDNSNDEYKDFKGSKIQRQINTHQSLENLIKLIKTFDLSQCDKIALIHISEELGDRDIMIEKIIEEFGVDTCALLQNGKEYY